MKKLVGLIATLLVVMSFVGCASSDVVEMETNENVGVEQPYRIMSVNQTPKLITYKTIITPENHEYNIMQIEKWVYRTLKEKIYNVGAKNAFLGKSWGDADDSEYRPTIVSKSDYYITGFSNIGKGITPYFFDFEIEFAADNELYITYSNFKAGTKKGFVTSNYYLEDLSDITQELFNSLK